MSCPAMAFNRKNAVPGNGNPDAPAMLVAERPGWYEDQAGVPMIGRAGELFDQILHQVGLSRKHFFITNVIKCLPPKGHVVSMEELEHCEGWLDEQIRVVAPRILVTCGALSSARYFPREKVGDIHGKARRLRDRIVIPTYHPASAMYNTDLREQVVKDFETVAAFIRETNRGRT